MLIRRNLVPLAGLTSTFRCYHGRRPFKAFMQGQIGCQNTDRTCHDRINSPVPKPFGTSGKNKWSG